MTMIMRLERTSEEVKTRARHVIICDNYPEKHRIKQHLRIKSFYGSSENAVKSQIWIAVSVYVLIAIIKKRLDLEAGLYTILQTLSLTLFEKIPLNQLLKTGLDFSPDPAYRNQLKLFDETLGQ